MWVAWVTKFCLTTYIQLSVTHTVLGYGTILNRNLGYGQHGFIVTGSSEVHTLNEQCTNVACENTLEWNWYCGS